MASDNRGSVTFPLISPLWSISVLHIMLSLNGTIVDIQRSQQGKAGSNIEATGGLVPYLLLIII